MDNRKVEMLFDYLEGFLRAILVPGEGFVRSGIPRKSRILGIDRPREFVREMSISRGA